MNTPIFHILYSDFDYSEYYFFTGPEGSTQEDFERVCEELIPKAAFKALGKKNVDRGWMCWSHVVESLVSLVQERGYQRIELKPVKFDCAGIIGRVNCPKQDERLDYAKRSIFEYNFKIEKKMREEREAKLKTGAVRRKLPQLMK